MVPADEQSTSGASLSGGSSRRSVVSEPVTVPAPASGQGTPRGLSALLESRHVPTALLGAAFLVRLAWILLVDPKPFSDW